jgi:tyrosine decarboxylase / aspartate 1-decarboxylase
MNDIKANKIIKELEKYKELDFSYSKAEILGSMCTQPHPIAKKAYMKFLDSNIGDPELFPGSKKIEEKYISFILKLLNSPKNSTCIIGSGGTESNINAIWLAKNLSRKKEIIVPKSAHFSFEKIASLMDIKIKTITLDNNYTIDISILKKKINKNTAAVVGIAGTTELGKIDPISEMSDICKDEHIFLHVDAAFGGFVVPFLKNPDYNFDFKLPGVCSITIDAHKMGCAAIPLGILALRDKKWLEQISVDTPYISSKKQAGILATRSAGPIAAAYAVSEHLGFKGYFKIVEKCMNNTKYAEEKIKNTGLDLVAKPTLNVLAVKIKKPAVVVEELTKKGWKVNKMDRYSAIRLVFMPHVTRKAIDKFLPVFENVCKKTGEI